MVWCINVQETYVQYDELQRGSHMPCRSRLHGVCDWVGLGYKSVVCMCLCTIGKESQQCSKPTRQLYAVLLSPMMARDW